MGLKWFKIQVTWDRSYCEVPATAAITGMERWKYREYDITYFLPKLSEMTDEEVEGIVVHELCHCLLAPMTCNMEGTNEDNSYRRDLVEFNTELVASAMGWVWQAGKDDKVSK